MAEKKTETVAVPAPYSVSIPMVIRQIESATPPGTKSKFTYPRWGLFWPNNIQQAAFAFLTRDELFRFPGLREFLMKDERRIVPITLTLVEKLPK